MGLSGDNQGLVTNVVINVIIFFAIMIAFLITRRMTLKNRELARRAVRPDYPPNRGTFTFILDTFKYRLDDIFLIHGIDAVMFVRFVRSFMFAFILIFLFDWIILVPIYATGGNNNLPVDSEKHTSGYEILDASNLKNKSPRYTAVLFSTMFNSLVVLLFLFFDFKALTRYRVMDKLKNLPENYAVMITQIPWRYPTANLKAPKVDSGIQEKFPGTPAGENVPCPTLGQQLTYFFGLLYPQSLISGIVSYALRPIWSKQKKYMKAAEKVEEIDASNEKTGKRKLKKVHGKKVDASEFYHERMANLKTEIEQAQQNAVAHPFNKANKVGFVIFKDKVTAAVAAQAHLGNDRNHWVNTEAPDPRDIQWQNLHISDFSFLIRTLIVSVLIFLLIFFWSIPVLFAASIANLQALENTSHFGWVRHINDIPVISGIIIGFLPSLIIIIFQALVPTIIRVLVGFQGYYLKSREERAARDGYFLFLLFNLLFVYTVGGSFMKHVQEFTTGLSFSQVVTYLSQTIPQQGGFFSNYTLQRTSITLALLVLGIGPLIKYFINHMFTKSDAKKKRGDIPPPFAYFSVGAVILFMGFLGIAYSSISPLVVLFITVFFCVAYWVVKYLITFFNVPENDGKGHFWVRTVIWIIVALLVYQMTTFGVLLLAAYFASVVIFLPFVFTIAFAFFMYYRFSSNVSDPSVIPLIQQQAQVLPAKEKQTVDKMEDIEAQGQADPNVRDSAVLRAEELFVQPQLRPVDTVMMSFRPQMISTTFAPATQALF